MLKEAKTGLFLLLIVFLSLFNLSIRAQVFSEELITYSEKGERLTTMFYVKFKPGDVINIPFEKDKVGGDEISNKYQGIKNSLTDFCKTQELELSEIVIGKAIHNARDEDTLFTDLITKEVKKLPNLARIYTIRFPKQVNIDLILSTIKELPEVEYAHLPVQLVDCAVYPNDQYYSSGGQWYLNTIKAPEAWDITKGSSNIKIALIESGGVELTHTDLQSKIVGGDNNPAGISSGHGTWVAGFAGASTNNTNGVASLGWDLKILTYQPNNDNSQRRVTAQKIKDAGAHVINLSFKTIKTGFSGCTITPPLAKATRAIAPEYYI